MVKYADAVEGGMLEDDSDVYKNRSSDNSIGNNRKQHS